MRSSEIFSLLVGIFLVAILLPTQGQYIHTGEEELDGESYILQWGINADDEIHFVMVVETTGYVGLGISPNGGMTGADIFIAGVDDDGVEYWADRHATGQSVPIVDKSQDWTLDLASQNGTHTTIRVHRLLNTCDEEEDAPITDATMHVIWAVGHTDTIEQHQKRGSQSINFFLQDGTVFDPTSYDKLDIITDSTMPKQHTSYLCTFHERPILTETRHIVAFEPIFDNDLAREHTHHFSFYKCVAPEGKTPEEVFGPFVGQQGRHCYDQYNVTDFPIAYCMQNFVYVWSKGGKRMAFPSDIGFPVPGELNRKEYYALEVHYDNPREDGPLAFETGGRIYYTKAGQERENEASMLIVAHDTAPQLTVPPASQNFVVAAHCSSACTQAYFPEEGLTIFNNLFHSHLIGRKMKLRHFRGEEELPWIDVDDYYDFDYQQNKPLSNPVKIMKGDQLTVECTYDNSDDTEHKAVIGGLSSHEEMCEAILYVYPSIPLWLCDSSHPLDKHFELLGVTDYEMKNATLAGGLPAYDIKLPANLAGDYLESMTSKFDWTDEFRQRYQEEKRFGLHEGSCCAQGEDPNLCDGGDVKYPENFEEYVPINECNGGGSTTEGETDPTSEEPGNTTAGTDFVVPNYKGIAIALVSLYVLLSH